MRANSPLRGGRTPAAAASAAAAAADCATEQIPQMRGTMVSASSGARPASSCSKPRNSGALTRAARTLPSVDVEQDFEIALDAVEGAEPDARHLPALRTGGRTTG